MPTKIEWTEETWNPITGCTKVSSGCTNCYAERMAKRLKGRYGYPKDDPFRVTLHKDKLDQPLRWEKPRTVFVVSMGDIFHDDVDPKWIDAIWRVMAACPQHTFQVLTKRPENIESKLYGVTEENPVREMGGGDYLPNVWMGVTAENQEQADKRTPIFLQIPAAVRFVSVEPMLGPVLLTDMEGPDIYKRRWLEDWVVPGGDGSGDTPGLDWVICGGESGPGARPMHPDWARSLRDQCRAAGVPFFFKQWGQYGLNWLNDDDGNKIEGSEWMDSIGKKKAGRLLDGREWNEMPERDST